MSKIHDERYVIVTPLGPPFDGEVRFFDFEGEHKTLAVSASDGDRINALLDYNPTGRTITLSAVGDKIRVEVLPQ